MTCIAAVVTPTRVWMGSDSLEASSPRYFNGPAKMTRRNGWLIGLAGQQRDLDLICRGSWRPPTPPKRSFRTFVQGPFIDALRDFLSAQDRWDTLSTDDVPGLITGEMLVATGQKLFQINNCLAVHQIRHYYSIGSGGDVGNGSLGTSTGAPRKRILKALRLSAKHIIGVGPPYHVLHT